MNCGRLDHPAIKAALAEPGDLWIFGYGSLMWNPGFRHAEARSALLYGYHRRFCVYSRRYRGTPESPGVVLGLDVGGACCGMAFRIPRRHARAAMLYLWERELRGGVYHMQPVRLRLREHRPATCAAVRRGRCDKTIESARIVRAHAFVVNREHQGYTGELGVTETARLILQGAGRRGPCTHYLESTVRHLEELGLDDGPLHRLAEVVRRLAAAAAPRPAASGRAAAGPSRRSRLSGSKRSTAPRR